MAKKWILRTPAITASSFLVILGFVWWTLSIQGMPDADRERDRQHWLALYEKGRLVQARDELQEYLERAPADDEAREILADIRWRQGRPGQALAELRRVGALSTGGRFRMGILALRLGDATMAVESLGAVDSVQSQSFQFRYESVRALVAGGRLGSAVKEWERVAEHIPAAARAVLAPSWSTTMTPGWPNIFIAGLTGTSTTGTVEISGIATGPMAGGVNLLVVGDDGRFWDVDDSTWSVDPVFNESDPVSVVREDSFWHSRWRPPAADGRRLLIIASTGTATGTPDSLPAATLLTIDNKPPVIASFDPVRGGSEVTEARALVKGEVVGAVWMRFADRPEKLRTTAYIPYTSTTTVDLPPKDGRRHIYGQWRDAAGNETAPGTSGSRATVFVDTTPPEIAAVFPRNRATDVNTDLLLTVNFAESRLDASSISPRTFKLYDADGEEVSGEVRYDSEAKTAVFSPHGPLAFGTDYEAVLAADVRDELGNQLAQDQRWRFTTVRASDHAPDPPRDLTVVSGSDGNKLSWTAPVVADSGGDFDPPVRGGYNIYRGSNRRSVNEPVNLVPVTATEFIDKEYGRAGLRYYRVSAVDAGGGESVASPVRSNRVVRAVFVIGPGHDATLTTSNGLIAVTPVPTTGSVKLTIESRRQSGAPASPSPAVELSTDRPLRLRRLRLSVPGEPEGAVILRTIGGGWQVLPRSLHAYDSDSGGVSYGPLAAKGMFVIVNPADVSPPPAPGPLLIEDTGKGVSLTWGRTADGESGIDRYRLFFSDRPFEATPTPASSTDTSAAPKTLDIIGDSLRFTDNRDGLRQRYYAVAAVNGAGLVSRIATAAVSIETTGPAEHRPALVDAGSCRRCHLLTSAVGAGEGACGLCHDGTGSRVALADIKAGPESCRSCHDLSPTQLVVADSAPRICGGCHDAVTKGISPVQSSHGADAGLTGVDCQGCHSLHRPQPQSTAFLVDPYNTRRVWDGDRERFCFSCHDGKRLPAATETPGRFVSRTVNRVVSGTPRSLGPSPQAWASASHEALTGCDDCHAPHVSTAPALAAFKLVSGDYKYFSGPRAVEDLCLECHGPSSSSPAVEVGSAHGDGERRAGCPDCHDVHNSRESARRLGSNRTAGPLRGISGLAPINGGPGTLPKFIPVEPAVYEYQVCMKCHAGALAALFNPENPSYHPVEAPVRESVLANAALVGPWRAATTMYCSDCHRSNSGVPAGGPHASEFASLLAAPFGEVAAPGRENDLCWLCHERKVYERDAKGSRFRGPGGHGAHVGDLSIACYQCHDVHGNSFTKHLVWTVTGLETSGTTAFTHDSEGGGCLANCHRDERELIRYEHAY